MRHLYYLDLEKDIDLQSKHTFFLLFCYRCEDNKTKKVELLSGVIRNFNAWNKGFPQISFVPGSKTFMSTRRLSFEYMPSMECLQKPTETRLFREAYYFHCFTLLHFMICCNVRILGD